MIGKIKLLKLDLLRNKNIYCLYTVFKYYFFFFNLLFLYLIMNFKKFKNKNVFKPIFKYIFILIQMFQRKFKKLHIQQNKTKGKLY